MSPEMITKLVEAAITIIIGLVSVYIIPWLRTKIGEDRYAVLLDFAEIVVRSAEKIYTPEEWAEKKKYAVQLVSEKSKDIGLDLSEEEINAIIEGAVHAVKG